jgi:hypothetical protein
LRNMMPTRVCRQSGLYSSATNHRSWRPNSIFESSG